ncbi:5156_t:CDS:2 [Funneliformis caledonium]|uniref:5156_t:CDS:1 n=1 Tax=Funneliformis caledonium TaxID=1117310 RepID=A0A9N9BQC3_9GLOM|nr:5156_t:CDS:2 [Funneliformis caledonium]
MYQEKKYGKINDAIYNGLQVIKNAIEDKCIVLGAGVFQHLLIIPKVLSQNRGFNAQDTIVTLQEEFATKHIIGVDLNIKNTLDPIVKGI